MSFDRAKAALYGTRFADLRWVPSTGSTNEDARALVPELERDHRDAVVLVADHQSAGRGRMQRIWEAPPGTSVLMTIVIRADRIPADRRPLASFALALAVSDAEPSVSLKWPNDLIVPAGPGDPLGYRKLGGILAESFESPGAAWVLLGLGLNANWPSIPDELASIATSLNRVLGHEVDREILVADVLLAFETRWLPLLESSEGVPELLEEYRQRCSTLGERVRVELPGSQILGRATAVEPDGTLRVVDDAGRAHDVSVGDVVHVRPDSPQGSTASS